MCVVVVVQVIVKWVIIILNRLPRISEGGRTIEPVFFMLLGISVHQFEKISRMEVPRLLLDCFVTSDGLILPLYPWKSR